MISLLTPPKDNLVEILSSFLDDLNIPVSKYSINSLLKKHPAYPSLLAVSDCLSLWHVPHQCIKVNKDNFDFSALESPILVHLIYPENRFATVYKIENDKIEIRDGQKISHIDKELLLAHWDGVILYAEKDDQAGEKDYNDFRIKGWIENIRLPLLLFCITLSLALTVIGIESNPIIFVLLATKIIAAIIIALLVWTNISAENSIIKKICGSQDDKNNCSSLLSSKAAKITGWLSWSEVGMVYFMGSLTSLIFFPASLEFLKYLNLLAIPFTFYSIAFQLYTKKWCVLCCMIQGIIWLEAILFAMASGFEYPVGNLVFVFPDVLKCTAVFVIITSVWMVLKPLILNTIEKQDLAMQLSRFKSSSELFNTYLSNGPQYDVPDAIKPIILGDQQSKTTITIVSNPFCPPCAAAHRILDEWLESGEITLKIILLPSNLGQTSRDKVVAHILSLQLKDEPIHMALKDWFSPSNKSYESWAIKYPVDMPENTAILKDRLNWMNSSGIDSTPTIFINDRKLSLPYELSDIRYLLD